MESVMWHVTSTRNRASIDEFGLDCSRMSAARGIAGSERPEQDGVFLCTSEFYVDFFLRLNNTGGPVDVWSVDGVDRDALLDAGAGFGYLPGTVARSRVALVRTDVEPEPEPEPQDDVASGAYSSRLTVTLDDT